MHIPLRPGPPKSSKHVTTWWSPSDREIEMGWGELRYDFIISPTWLNQKVTFTWILLYLKNYRCISWDFSHRFTSFKSSKPQLRCSLPLASGARSLSAFLAAGGLFVLLSMLSPSTKQGSEAEAQMEPTGDGYLQHPRKFSELKTMIFWAIEIELGCIPTEIWLRIQLLNGLHIHCLRIIFGAADNQTQTLWEIIQ